MKEIKQPMFECEICGKIAKNKETIEKCEAKHKCKCTSHKYYFSKYSSYFYKECYTCGKREKYFFDTDAFDWDEFLGDLPSGVIKIIWEYIKNEKI